MQSQPSAAVQTISNMDDGKCKNFVHINYWRLGYFTSPCVCVCVLLVVIILSVLLCHDVIKPSCRNPREVFLTVLAFLVLVRLALFRCSRQPGNHYSQLVFYFIAIYS